MLHGWAMRNQGIVDRRVAVRVVLPHRLTDDGRTLAEGTRMPQAEFVHGKEDPPVYRLQPIAHVRQCTAYDDAHRIINERILQFLLNRDWLDTFRR